MSIINRQFLSITTDDEGTENERTQLFRFYTLNCLADSLCDVNAFKNTNPEYLTWNHRSNLLKQELTRYTCDSMHLCEVDETHYKTFFEPLLIQLGYGCIFMKKQSDNTDGSILAWNNNTFECVNACGIRLGEKWSQIAVIGHLISKKNKNIQITIAGTHLKAKPPHENVREQQIIALINHVNIFRKNNNYNGEIIIAGDFNDIPTSKVWNKMNENFNTISFDYTTCKKREELIKREIDYIWFSDLLKPIKYLSIPNPEEFPEYLPALNWPSDHLGIGIIFNL